MKNKNALKLILISLLLVLLSIALVACGNKGGSGGEEGGGEGGGDKPVATTFTVTFDSNGSSITYPSQEVVYGGKVANPNGGDESKDPFKTGYKFKYWANSNSTDVAWDFDTNTITSATTIIAVYDPKTYPHLLDLNTTNPDASCSQTTFTSTYNQAATMPVPTALNSSGVATDQFIYWYYLDDDNKEVRFSYWLSYTMQTASSGYSSSTDYYVRNGSLYSLANPQPTSSADFDDDTKDKYFVRNSLTESENFTLDKVLTLKAKWYSQLPTTQDENDPLSAHKVAFVPDNGDVASSVVVVYNDTVAAPTEPTKADYKFEGWFVAVENENGTIEYDGKKYSLTSNEFHFDAGPKTAEFDKVTEDMVLAAKWTRYYEIASATDWELFAGLINNATTEDEKAAAQELLAGKIVLTGDVTLTTLDSLIIKGTFSGEFDGQYDEGGTLKNRKITITLDDTYRPTSNKIALFEKITGTVKHVDLALSYNLHKLDLDTTIFDGTTSKSFYIGGLAAELDNATIQNVNTDALIGIPDDASTSYADISFIIGGLAALIKNSEVTGDWKATGVYALDFKTEKEIKAGILAGEAKDSLITLGTSDDITILANVEGKVYIGGLVGVADANITKVSIVSDASCPLVISVTSNDEVNVGGIVGYLTQKKLSESYIQSIETNVIEINGVSANNEAAVGGLVGRNNGTVNNSYVKYAIVTSKASTIACAGGIAGKCVNNSESYAFGKIEYCYIANMLPSDEYASIQESIKAIAGNENTKVYAGGISGDSAKCSIVRSFAYAGVMVDLENGNMDLYSMGYVVGHKDSASSIDSCYSDAESINTANYPLVSMKVKATNGTTYTYKIDDDIVYNVNEAINTIGATSFRDGQFMYTTMSWNNSIWTLFDSEPVVYTTELPELRA